MTRHFFPYGIRFRQDRRMELFPAAELLITGRRNRGMPATFHLDSGATVTVLPASDAHALGIPLRHGKKVVIGGISGEPLTGYQQTIGVSFATERRKIPVVFVDRPDVPRILGRDGVFTQFTMVFDEARRRVAFLDASGEREVIDPLFTTEREP